MCLLAASSKDGGTPVRRAACVAGSVCHSGRQTNCTVDSVHTSYGVSQVSEYIEGR